MLAALLTLVAGEGSAASSNPCLGRKLGDVGRAANAAVACWARDAAKPDPTARAACLAKAEARFTGGDDPSRSQFAKRERRPPCLTVGDQDAIAAGIEADAAVLATLLGRPGLASRCDAAKLTCLGKHLSATFTCLARAAAGSGVVDASCLARQTVRLGGDADGCLGKAATRGGCSASTEASVLAAEVETFAAETLCALDPNGTTECTALPTPLPTPTRAATPVATRTPTPVPTGSSGDASQLCVDLINGYRASIGRQPLARWTGAEACVEDQGFADMASGRPHSAFGQCGEWAQNECPGWPGPPGQMIGGCLQVMWAEGPGEPYSAHGHYINMANPGYTKVACGFAERSDGRVWAIQDFQ